MRPATGRAPCCPPAAAHPQVGRPRPACTAVCRGLAGVSDKLLCYRVVSPAAGREASPWGIRADVKQLPATILNLINKGPLLASMDAYGVQMVTLTE